LKHIYASIRQRLALDANPADFKPKADFEKEFLAICPADFKVPVSIPPNPSAKHTFLTQANAYIKANEVTKCGVVEQWGKYDSW
jgi:hypothetical protein